MDSRIAGICVCWNWETVLDWDSAMIEERRRSEGVRGCRDRYRIHGSLLAFAWAFNWAVKCYCFSMYTNS